MLLNGTDITPGRNKNKRATFAISEPIPMTDLEKKSKPRPSSSWRNTWDSTLVKQRYRPRNRAMQAIIDKELDKMLEEGVVRPSSSPWSSPVVITRRKDGKPRFCIDFWKLNSVTRRDAYPLPQVNATLDKLRGDRYLSTIYLKNGYWHVSLAEGSKPLTAFTVHGTGLFEFNVKPLAYTPRHPRSSNF